MKNILITHKKGFTLIELLIVIAIIGALASIVVVSLSGSTNQAKEAVLTSNFGQVERIITAASTVKAIKAGFCIGTTSEDKALQQIIKSYELPNQTAGSGTFSTRNLYHDGGDGNVAGNDDISTVKSGCLSKGTEAVVWLTGTSDDGSAVTYCVDSGGSIDKNLILGSTDISAVDATCASID